MNNTNADFPENTNPGILGFILSYIYLTTGEYVPHANGTVSNTSIPNVRSLLILSNSPGCL